MKPKRFLALALFAWLAAVPTGEARAQWVDANGQRSRDVFSFARIGTNTFAGTDVGVIVSTDSGITWKEVGLQNVYPGTIIAIGANLFTIGESGVFLSTDSASSWSAVDSGLPKNAYLEAFAASGTSLFVGLDYPDDSGAVFRSTDSGKSWIPTNLPNFAVHTLSGNDSNIFVATSGGIFHSTDNGISWTIVFSNNTVQVLLVNGEVLFAERFCLEVKPPTFFGLLTMA